MTQKKATSKLVLAMFIFGTIGIFRKYLPYSSGFIACIRGLIGAIFLSFLMVFRKQKVNKPILRKAFTLLLLSGLFLGGNWVLLFEAYRYTSVAVATICYYLAPAIAMLLATILFGEKMTCKNIICILLSLFGLIFVCRPAGGLTGDGKGILFGLFAAFLYAAVMLCARLLSEVGSYEKTTLQLLVSSIAVGIYSFFMEDKQVGLHSFSNIFLLLVVGIVHTGIAYVLYFDSIGQLSTQTVSILSFLDPLCSILLSACFLREPISSTGYIGIILILTGTVINEALPLKKEDASSDEVPLQ